MKKNKALISSIIMVGILLSLILNYSYSSWKGNVDLAKTRFPYYAVTKTPVNIDMLNAISAHKNIKKTYIFKDLKSVKFNNQLAVLNEASLEILENSNITAGRLPQNNKEIIISEDFSKANNLNIGDEITLDIGERKIGSNIIYPSEYNTKDEIFEILEKYKFKLVGVFENPKNIFIIQPITMTKFDPNSLKNDEKVFIAFDFVNKFTAYQTLEELKNLFDSGDSYDEIFTPNEELLKAFGINKGSKINLTDSFISSI